MLNWLKRLAKTFNKTRDEAPSQTEQTAAEPPATSVQPLPPPAVLPPAPAENRAAKPLDPASLALDASRSTVTTAVEASGAEPTLAHTNALVMADIPEWSKQLPQNILFFDVETTGLFEEDRIVSFAGILLNTSRLHERYFTVKHVHLILNPQRACHARASAVHGYDDWTLFHQPTFREEIDIIETLFLEAELLVAHNASFDMRFIQNEFVGLRRKFPKRPVYCTMQAWRSAGNQGSAKLDVVAANFGHARSSQRHGAFEDAWLAMAVYLGINTPLLIPSFNAGEARNSRSPRNLRPVPPRPPRWRLQEGENVIAQPIIAESKQEKRGSVPRFQLVELEKALNQANTLQLWELLDVVKELQRRGRLEEALTLCLSLVERVEVDPDSNIRGAPPAYHERAAIILRKLGRRDQEISILERFAGLHHGPGVVPGRLMERLKKLKHDASQTKNKW